MNPTSERLVGAFEAVRSFVDRYPPTLDQAVLARVILERHFGHHVRRMRQTYAERMAVMRQAAQRHLAGLLDVEDTASGIRTIAWIKTNGPDTVLAARARDCGLEFSALSSFSVRHYHPPALVLGFAGSIPSELRRGIGVLAAAIT